MRRDSQRAAEGGGELSHDCAFAALPVMHDLWVQAVVEIKFSSSLPNAVSVDLSWKTSHLIITVITHDVSGRFGSVVKDFNSTFRDTLI